MTMIFTDDLSWYKYHYSKFLVRTDELERDLERYKKDYIKLTVQIGKLKDGRDGLAAELRMKVETLKDENNEMAIELDNCRNRATYYEKAAAEQGESVTYWHDKYVKLYLETHYHQDASPYIAEVEEQGAIPQDSPGRAAFSNWINRQVEEWFNKRCPEDNRPASGTEGKAAGTEEMAALLACNGSD